MICPVLAFGANTVLNLMDKGTTFFPYFKLVCFFVIIFLGIFADLISRYVQHKFPFSQKRKPAIYDDWDSSVSSNPVK